MGRRRIRPNQIPEFLGICVTVGMASFQAIQSVCFNPSIGYAQFNRSRAMKRSRSGKTVIFLVDRFLALQFTPPEKLRIVTLVTGIIAKLPISLQGTPKRH
ncbi:hypothetical protein BJX62DRAFT_207572 [Aspergillus germanicus]